MSSSLKRQIRHRKTRSGILVPLLEDLFASPVEVETQDDLDFITGLLRSNMTRERTRRGQPVYSPSALAECLRRVYLAKHHKELGIAALKELRIEPNFYFFTGNWIHVKWQFALYKLAKHINDASIFHIYGMEIPVRSKHGDHGGTLDVLAGIYGEPYVLDVKGLNVRTFGEITRGYIPENYAVQLTDYMALYNVSPQVRRNGHKVTNGLLVVENKGGPDPKHPIALVEKHVEISLHLPKVQHRLRELRKHGEANTIPEPECVSTKTIQFQGCAFRAYCRGEVQAIESERRKLESRNSDGLKVAVPRAARDSRTRRNSKR